MNEPTVAIYVAMAVALAVWGGLFVYLWRLDALARNLRRRVERQPEQEQHATPRATLERRSPAPAAPPAEEQREAVASEQ
jgi:hypothetical protein